jgi:hypothetical protein
VRFPHSGLPNTSSVAYVLYLRDRRIIIHIAALCACYSVRQHGDCLKEGAARVRAPGRDNPSHNKYTSPAVLEFAPVVVGAFHFARKSIA